MNTSTSAILGLVFLGLGNASVFLMYKLWGYPFDKETRTSAAPSALMLLHRIIDYAYGVLYVFMMWHMVPRLWNYQVELPPRTVAHLMLGITIGVLLLMRISILRFFRHFEESMPYLGSALLICTYLLIGLSVPFTLRERALRTSGKVFSDAGIQRTRERLETAGLPDEASLDKLASRRKLRDGQKVLLRKCVQCHDLQTILVRPRTPRDWVRTVSRMAIKPVIGAPITEAEQWTVSTYLIAITPDLHKSAKAQRERKIEEKQAQDAWAGLFGNVPPQPVASTPTIEMPEPIGDADYNPETAKALFSRTCAQCHELTNVENSPPTSEADTRDLIARMIKNGLTININEIAIIVRYLNETFVGRL